MSTPQPDATIHRILVALDASAYSLAALEAAAHLAVALEAELDGLYVEDINLLHWADLPFTRVVRYPASVDEAVDKAGMEKQLQQRAEQARRALMNIARELKLPWSFKVVRGQVTPVLLAAALEADLLALGWISYPRTRRMRLGSTARALVMQLPCVVWLPPRRELPEGAPVFVTYDGSPVAQKALALAERLSTDLPIICVLTGPADAVRQLKEEALARLTTKETVQITFRHLPEADAESLARLVGMEHGGLLVISGEIMTLPASALESLLDQLECSVILVR